MAYSDPAYIRKHPIKVSLNDPENELLDSICALLGNVERAAYLRQKAFEKIREELAFDDTQSKAG